MYVLENIGIFLAIYATQCLILQENQYGGHLNCV